MHLKKNTVSFKDDKVNKIETDLAAFETRLFSLSHIHLIVWQSEIRKKQKKNELFN